MTPSRPSRSRSRSPIVRVTFDAVLLVAAMFGPFAAQATAASEAQEALLKSVGSEHGIVAVLDFPDSDAASVLELAQGNHWRIYFQSDKPEQVDQVRKAADEAGLLGTRLFVDAGSFKQIQLANNVADGLVVSPNAATRVKLDEMFRVLRPKASVIVDSAAVIAKPLPAGTDVWSHPYHGPDNNPQSKDKIARGELRTQFINEPKFSPMPEQTVIAGGRIYKALGHIAHRRNQNKQLNTLFCINAYNGTILWKRSLPEGFMIHRNTMVATDDALYLGDNESCKVLDAKTGRVLENITFAKDLTDGPVWKWMAIDDGTLYAMIGNEEVKISTRPSDKPGLGHWPWEMWQGHEYANPKTSFGFGRTIVAIDLKTKKLKWNYQSEEFIDARALAMNNNHILAYSPEKFLTAVDRTTGEVAWQTDSADVLAAIGALGGAQHWVTGYSTTCYMKCSDDYVYFAGPQCKRMTVVSAANGELAWTHPDGNLQLVLRDDAIYAAGPKSTGVRLDYKTGKVLGELPTRRACTRATGAVDSVFYRAKGGTVRVLTDSKESDAQHIAAMRPPCQDGVIISNGHFYWGPWMCGCELSLYGNIALGPAAGRTFPTDASLYKSALATISGKQPAPLAINENDWPSFRAGNQRHDRVSFTLPRSVKTNWQSSINTKEMPTAPVAAGDMVFVADRSGVVQAYAADGTTAWKNYTGGAIYYAPAVANDRLYVGSADGRVYAFAAKTGELLWSFQVAPAVERINVFGQLVSRWPVAGGVVVQGNKLYAVAGIANYDGTYVVALDAKSGELLAEQHLWQARPKGQRRHQPARQHLHRRGRTSLPWRRRLRDGSL